MIQAGTDNFQFNQGQTNQVKLIEKDQLEIDCNPRITLTFMLNKA